MTILTLPVIAWLVCGGVKFCVNCVRNGLCAFALIGHGGFPSNHTAIVSSIMWMLVLSSDWNIAALAVAVLMIHVFDAVGLRREIERHAVALNQLTGLQLRETVGHTSKDIIGGLVVGFVVAATYWWVGPK
jgi:acid phosphatase family membrane protein YuiD